MIFNIQYIEYVQDVYILNKRNDEKVGKNL